MGVTNTQAGGVLASLAWTAGATICLLAVTRVFDLNHVSIVYLIPVLVSAIRWGVLPAIVSALAGIGASAFFFYPPIYSFRVSNPQQVVDLVLFVLVAIVTSHLAGNVRKHFAIARQREEELRAIYAFSRRLAVAAAASDIYTAIQDHLSLVLERRVVLFESAVEARQSDTQGGERDLPVAVRGAIATMLKADSAREAMIADEATGARWLIRAVSPPTPAFGIVAVDIGRVSDTALAAISARVDAVLAEATATLDRLDVAHAISEARLRAESENFREALIGSVSHELRTPLASIVGSTYVLTSAPGVKDDPRLAALADDVRHEAERLNDDIQNLLDASRITGAGIRSHLQWADVADIVNAATERQQRRLSARVLELDIPGELSLVRVDPALIEQAMGQVLDNAVKYSPPGSRIRIAAAGHDGEVSIAIADQGVGLTDEERSRIWDRFYRSPRLHATTGSGLGLWIARAFVLATGGTIEAYSSGPGSGTRVTIRLPAPRPPSSDEVEGSDE